MSVTIFCSELSAAGRATTTSTAPQRLMVPASVMSPMFFDGRGFAGEIRFVRGGAPFGNFGVHGKLRAGLDQQTHSARELLDFDLALAAPVIQHGGDFRRVAEKRTDFLLRPAERVMFERAGK